MPQLIRNIQGQAYLVTTGSVIGVKTISGEVQSEDYINLNGFIAYLQNFTKVDEEYLVLVDCLNPVIVMVYQLISSP